MKTLQMVIKANQLISSLIGLNRFAAFLISICFVYNIKIILREGATSAKTGFNAGPLILMLAFVERGKPEDPEKNPRSKATQPTYGTGPELDTGHIRVRRALLPLRRPCFTLF